ncbi:CvpA family protein [Kiloniella laminariae]|uniref:CvpA family protein n=1 Tax=Kiloniella laminariae TaxID=454162 RepID=UPI00036675C4|nr:CvpA family protein [Kiloniella laminariae]
MENLPISLLDVAVIGILAVSGLFALFRGIVHEVLSVASWIGAGFITLWGFHPLLPHIQKFINIPFVAELVTGFAIFVIALGLMMVVIRMICKHVRESTFGPLDRSLGFLFGLVRGAVIVCICWMVFFVFLMPQEEGWPQDVERAKTRPAIQQGSALLVRIVPEKFHTETLAKVLQQAEAARQVYNATQTYQQLIKPELPAPAPKEGEPGYNDTMRTQMQKTIEAVNGSE